MEAALGRPIGAKQFRLLQAVWDRVLAEYDSWQRQAELRDDLAKLIAARR